MELLFIILVFLVRSSQSFEFDPKPRSQDVTDNRAATLTCGASGGTPSGGVYEISWLYNGQEVVSNNRRYQQGDNLYFKRVNRTLDSGEFQCQATNNVTSDYHVTTPVEFNIKWVSGGVVTLKLPSPPDKILPGVKVVIKCGVEGNPKPTGITWSLNGVPINSSSMESRNKRLSINRAVLTAYDGNYACCMRHPLGKTCSAALNLKVIDPRSPVLTLGPAVKDKFVRKGQRLWVPCRWEATPRPLIQWFRDSGNPNKPLDNKTKPDGSFKRCVYPNGTLFIENIKQAQEGAYRCVATSQLGKSPPVIINIKIATVSLFLDAEVSRHAGLGTNFEYSCLPHRAIPKPTITWLRNNAVIGENSQHISSSHGTLVIDKARSEDEGTYTCVAENVAGRATMNMSFLLEEAPTCSKLPDLTVNEGSTAGWECPCGGIPAPHVAWFKDGAELAAVEDKVILSGKSIVIKDVRSGDKGIYSCSATSSIGKDSTNATRLTVNESFKISPKLSDKCLEEGSKVGVFCEVEGSKNPKVSWKKINSSLILNSATLSFDPVTFEDEGRYRCEASDGVKITAKVIQVKVVPRTRIIAGPENVTVFDDVDSVLLDCKVNNNESEVKWEFQGHTFTHLRVDSNQRALVLVNGSLVVLKPTVGDTGVYRCSYDLCDGVKVGGTAALNVFVADNEADDDITKEDNGSPAQMIQTVALSVSGGVAYILLTVALIIYCRGKHKKKRKEGNSLEETEVMINGPNGDLRHDNDIQMTDISDPRKWLETLNYPSTNIHSLTLIGRGKFGKVFLSKAPGLFPDLEEDILVMVKSSQPDMSGDLRSEFNREVNILRLSSHENIARLLALSSHGGHGNQILYLITEYLEWGILKLCLQASREGKVPAFTKNHKMSICSQLASGLAHLSKQGLLHGDVATRNCVVSSQLLVKISFLGLSQEGFQNEYVEHEEREIPLRWIPPEVLSLSEYSMKSDVFAFGVSCWEVFTLGELPCQELADEEFLKELESGEIPPLPALENSRRITSLINKCRAPLPGNRPDIRQITKKLQSIIATNNGGKTKAIVTDDCEVIITADEE